MADVKDAWRQARADGLIDDVNHIPNEATVSIVNEASNSGGGPDPTLDTGIWSGWLADFRDWILPTTDGAEEAMFAYGSVELCLAIGRKIAIHYGRPTFPNLFACVVGPTGVPRKTTIQERGEIIRKRALSPGYVRLARSIGSAEGLLERFCEEVERGEGKNKRAV